MLGFARDVRHENMNVCVLVLRRERFGPSQLSDVRHNNVGKTVFGRRGCRDIAGLCVACSFTAGLVPKMHNARQPDSH